jgi:hypothetical protein
MKNNQFFYMLEFQLDKPYYYDIEPDEKSSDELLLLLMRDISGEKVNLNNYNENEINRCARQLILIGFLRGTIFDRDKCSWTKLTRKGRMHLEWLMSKDEDCII